MVNKDCLKRARQKVHYERFDSRVEKMRRPEGLTLPRAPKGMAFIGSGDAATAGGSEAPAAI